MPEKLVNEKFIQVRGKIAINRELKYGDDIQVTVSVTDIQGKDNQDETIDLIYKAKLLEVE